MEDEPIIAGHIRRMLEKAGHAPVALAATRDAALDCAAKIALDLAVVDVALPEGADAGIELAGYLRGRGVRVIFLTGQTDDRLVARARALGAVSYLVKPFTELQLITAVSFALGCAPPSSTDLSEVVATIEERLSRITTVLNDAGMAIAGAGELDERDVETLRQLSSREREVLDLLLTNRRVPQIAEHLSISQHTVRTHLKAIFRKLEVHSQSELIDRLRGHALPPR